MSLPLYLLIAVLSVSILSPAPQFWSIRLPVARRALKSPVAKVLALLKTLVAKPVPAWVKAASNSAQAKLLATISTWVRRGSAPSAAIRTASLNSCKACH